MSLRSFTLHDLIERNAARNGAGLAFAADGERVTHAQYAARVARLAAGLAGAGVGLGDRIALLAHNGLACVDLLGAAARLGAILVPVNWRLSADEVAHVIADSKPRVLVASPELQPLLATADLGGAQRVTTAVQDGLPWSTLASLYLDGTPAPVAAVDEDAGLAIVHTAAVDGHARGALLTHRGLLASAFKQVHAWALTSDDVQVGVLPLFHLAGIGMTLALLAAGGASLLMARFEPKGVVEAIESQGGTVIGTFPPMLASVLDAAAAAGSGLRSLRVVSGLDATETLARFAASCPQADFWVAYGQTETSGSITMARWRERPGSAGRPVEQHVVALVDEEDRLAPAGATGEIVVRGPMVFAGYWGRDEDNVATFRGGWHHTGDMGRFDADGFLWYMGRSPVKELVKPGGENVYPVEVERTLCQHPEVVQAVVFGVADVQWGEAVKAVCVRAPGSTLSADALIEFVGQRIARYKKPKHVVFVDALPLGATGTPDRAAVKAGHGG